MKLITNLLPHLFLYSILAVIGLTQCRAFFKSKLVDWEIVEEREVLKTVNPVDQGTIYSNSIFELNHFIAINRQDQVTFVEQIHLNHWACKNPLCGHQLTTEEFFENEGSLGNHSALKSFLFQLKLF